MRGGRVARAAGALVLAFACASAAAQGPAALVAIVIDDVGNVREQGLRALELPGPLTYAVLPYSPHGGRLARLAHALDKEVLVHLPMESVDRRPLGPGGLTSALTHPQFERHVRAALDRVPQARGVSNHMGSRLTAMPRPMGWLMAILAERRGMLFLDSRTTPETVAESSARAAGVRSAHRHVFLDNERDEQAIRARLDELVATARREGSAVAIGHPYPQTIRVLATELPRLGARGARLVPVSTVIARRGATSDQSRSPGHAARTRYTPSAPSTQLSSGAPATVAGWNPSRP